jgi:hypothetical protein
MPSDNSLLCLILEFQMRSLYVQHLLQAEATKEYKADWLKNANTVVRDGAGKFAKKGASVAQSVQDTTVILKQGFDLTGDTIQSLIRNPEFRKRAGLAAGLPMAKLISNLATQAKLNPKLTEKLDEWIANATKEFADQYGDDKSPIAQAIRNNKLPQPSKDASFNEKMEFHIAQYAAYKEALESPEDYSKRDEFIGKAAAASIPIGVSLAIALGFEVAIPLFLAQSVNWATVLSSVALGEVADFAVQKGMDKLEINNPALRFGASMVAGILAGGLVTGVNNKIKNTQRLAKEEAERLTKEKIERLAKKEIENKIKINEEFKNNLMKAFGNLFPDIKEVISSLEKEGISEYNYKRDRIGDLILNKITELRKFHKFPEEMSEKDMDILIEAGGHTELYRGLSSVPNMSANEMLNEFKHGVFYQGDGAFGQGTYSAASLGINKESQMIAKNNALHYAKLKLEHPGVVFRMAVSKFYKEITHKQLMDLIKGINEKGLKSIFPDIDQIPEDNKWLLNMIVNNPGYIASLLNYDAIKVELYDGLCDYMIILNRGIVKIQDKVDIVNIEKVN